MIQGIEILSSKLRFPKLFSFFYMAIRTKIENKRSWTISWRLLHSSFLISLILIHILQSLRDEVFKAVDLYSKVEFAWRVHLLMVGLQLILVVIWILFEFFLLQTLQISQILLMVDNPISSHLKQFFKIATVFQISHFYNTRQNVSKYETVLFIFKLVDIPILFLTSLPYLQLFYQILILLRQRFVLLCYHHQFGLQLTLVELLWWRKKVHLLQVGLELSILAY